MPARPGLAVRQIRVSGIENCHPDFHCNCCAADYPPTAYVFFAQPAGTTCSARRHCRLRRFADRHPAFKGEFSVSSAILTASICLSLRLQADAIRPEPDVIHCQFSSSQIHTHLCDHAALSGKAEATRPSAWCRRSVQPGAVDR